MRFFRKIPGYCWSLLSRTPLRNVPVRILRGPLKGTRWTLAPSSGYWRGQVEDDIAKVIGAEGLENGSVAWDLGAHFGYFSFLLRHAVGEKGKVYAFEPDPDSYSKIQKHIKLNAASNIHAFPYAVGDTEGVSPLIRCKDVSTVSHLPYVGETVPEGVLEVQTVTLDKMVAEKKIECPQFIKVDIEGHGGKALMGARETISESRPCILMSFHSPREVDTTLEVLSPLGYKPIEAGGDPYKWNTVTLRV